MIRLFRRYDVLCVYSLAATLLAIELALRSFVSAAVEPIVASWSVADLVELAIAVVLALWLLWRYWRFIPNFYRFAVAYPGLFLLLAFTYALVYAQIGTGFGVQYQFWHDDALLRLCGSGAVTLLLGVVGVLAYYVDPKPFWTAALIDDFFGEPDLRLAPAAGPPPAKFSWLKSPNVIRLSRFLQLARWAFLTLLVVPSLLPALFASVPRTPPWDVAGWGIIARDPTHGSYRWARQYYADVLPDPLARFASAGSWIAGVTLGVLIVKIMYWVAEHANPLVSWIGRWRVVRFFWKLPGAVDSFLFRRFRRIPLRFTLRPRQACHYYAAPPPAGAGAGAAAPPGGNSCPINECPAARPVDPEEHLEQCAANLESRASIVNFYVVFLAFYAALNLPGIYDYVVTAPFSICALLSLLAMTYTWFARFFRRWRVPVLFALLTLAWIANNDPFKLRFENMDGYYAASSNVVLRDEVHHERDEEKADSPADTQTPPRALIPNETARKNWRAQFPSVVAGRAPTGSATPEKPKLVVVAVSGGATRAGYWAGVVLERLEDELQKDGQGDFGRNVRIITGSSGGMLGAAFYVLHRVEQVPDDAKSLVPQLPDERGQPATPMQATWVDRIPLRSLAPVAKYIALQEPWKAFLPRLGSGDDRGIELERDWGRLRFPLRALAPLEERGVIPSLILSPMTIEDGRQLLITNLDLRLHNGPNENLRRWIGRSDGSMVTAKGAGIDQTGFSISGLEFFRTFPAADGFFVSTAVRMSASFPYVSPAVNLPTVPPHRVVDAGYYDNYGIQTGAAWIYFNREWLEANTSGVLLVQIRDSTSIVDRIGIDDSPETTWGTIARGFQFFTSPLEGFNRARFTSSSFRNDQAVQYLGDIFTEDMRTKMTNSRRFFTTIVLENAAEVTPMPHTDDWPGTEFVEETSAVPDGTEPTAQPGASASPAAQQAARRARQHHDAPVPTTGVSMTWYLTRAEREALDFAIPEPKIGSLATDRTWRTDHIDRLWKAIAKMPRNDPRRAHAMSDYQRVSNYERIIQLLDWWRRGLKEEHRPAPASMAPQ